MVEKVASRKDTSKSALIELRELKRMEAESDERIKTSRQFATALIVIVCIVIAGLTLLVWLVPPK